MTQGSHPDPTQPTSSARVPAGTPALDERVALLTDRRGLLKAAGVAGVAVVGAGALAACSSPPVPSSTSGGGAGSAGSSASSASSGSSGAAGGSGGGTPTADIPVGGGKVFPDSQTVVTQPTAGTFKAFDAICPHQGCTVDSVEGGQIICPCHQSHFDAATGDRVSGPAPTGLTPKKITVTGSSFTVS
ncbi:Rieske (2Fe-2S) protein [Terrabacter carboxydivorans]|uniref:Cytochrome bc1 complex Rieske iron-sulfur subunit n=1 Tax=Terrabacter carboxydivorans TaxID=619730 RepID=A0ABN3L5E2_9MICO